MDHRVWTDIVSSQKLQKRRKGENKPAKKSDDMYVQICSEIFLFVIE